MKVFVSLGHLLRGTFQSMCTHTHTLLYCNQSTMWVVALLRPLVANIVPSSLFKMVACLVSFVQVILK